VRAFTPARLRRLATTSGDRQAAPPECVAGGQEAIGLERPALGRAPDRVLVSPSRRRPSRSTTVMAATWAPRLTGRNRENRLVHLDGDPSLVGQLVAARIERAGPYALICRRLE
jgi:hypothetical protein